MDPIMWDPFRYKLGGRLLNGLGQEFVDRYGSSDDGRYVVTRDLATYAITKEVEAGRGSPSGGAWLQRFSMRLSRVSISSRRGEPGAGERPVVARTEANLPHRVGLLAAGHIMQPIWLVSGLGS
jgi:succinate dehydrogenase/fumarate reductase flavoprotein subunit